MKLLADILDSDAFRREFLNANAGPQPIIKGNADIEASSAWTYADIAQVEADLKGPLCPERI